ncbi:uncharacterized protein [Antedon mediterranea]|uniref:uncharacterized protein n=1 Tax=Antedon mediterranea TaxID=105859 RepID=UPI003AF9D476
MVGNTTHSINNSKELATEVKDLHVSLNHTFVSFDVVSLFTKTPTEKSLEIIHECLRANKTLQNRTKLKVEDVMELLSLVVNTAYFSFGNIIYRQKSGIAMGSPISLIVANLFLEWLETEAISRANDNIRPTYWRRYVDDVLAVVEKESIEDLNKHLNTIDPTKSIKFTTERMTDNTLPFLDCLITLKTDGTIETSIYRKPTHTDQYLNFKSNHPLEHKLSVINTLVDRCQNIVTTQQSKREEMKHIRKVLNICEYPNWAIDRVIHNKKEKNKSILII